MADTHVPGPVEEPAYATAATVAGLAREVDGLRRTVEDQTRIVETVGDLRHRVENLAGLVARLAERLAAKTAGGSRVATWLRHDPADVDADRLLDGLCRWLHEVFLRYTDAARALPECWLWHPDVVEELLWLWTAWLGAYDDPEARTSLAADWHDRLRPGVVRRIKDTYARACSIENHTPGRDRHAPAAVVPLADAISSIAAWWTHHRGDPPPAPTPQQLGIGAGPHHADGRRRRA